MGSRYERYIRLLLPRTGSHGRQRALESKSISFESVGTGQHQVEPEPGDSIIDDGRPEGVRESDQRQEQHRR